MVFLNPRHILTRGHSESVRFSLSRVLVEKEKYMPSSGFWTIQRSSSERARQHVPEVGQIAPYRLSEYDDRDICLLRCASRQEHRLQAGTGSQTFSKRDNMVKFDFLPCDKAPSVEITCSQYELDAKIVYPPSYGDKRTGIQKIIEFNSGFEEKFPTVNIGPVQFCLGKGNVVRLIFLYFSGLKKRGFYLSGRLWICSSGITCTAEYRYTSGRFIF